MKGEVKERNSGLEEDCGQEILKDQGTDEAIEVTLDVYTCQRFFVENPDDKETNVHNTLRPRLEMYVLLNLDGRSV